MKHDPTIDTMQKSDWDMQGPYVYPRQRTYDDLSMQEFDEVVSNFISKIDRSIEGAKTKTKPVISVDDLITEKENRLKKYHQIRMKKMQEQNENQNDSGELALVSWKDKILADAADFAAKAKEIIVTDVDQKDKMKEAGELRKVVKKLRTSVENRRKELTASLTRQKSMIDGVAREIKQTLEPIEDYLTTQEKFAELKAAKERADLLEKRRGELFGLVEQVPESIADLDDESFDAYLAGLKDQAKKRKEAEEAEEHARELKRKEEAEELERLRIQAQKDREERERLEKEAAEQKALIEKAEKEAREAREAQERAEKEAEQAKEKTERVLADPFGSNAKLEQIEMFDPFGSSPQVDDWDLDKEQFETFAKRLFEHRFVGIKTEKGQRLAENIESLKKKLYLYISDNI